MEKKRGENNNKKKSITGSVRLVVLVANNNVQSIEFECL